MAATSTPGRARGRGWRFFAGILLILAGVMQFMDGLWALDRQDTAIDTVFWGDNLEAWGWLYLLVGVVLIVTGIFVLRRAFWATNVAIAIACLGAIINIFWIFSYPLASVLHITLNLLVVYGLTTYTMDDLEY
ncbi:MAG TPA: hypothetical protein VFG85_05165 [Gaiellaceae bacterium]|jgi:hypothetical protein|nr:hypothetical protein [Gaiellaceae bacterium]